MRQTMIGQARLRHRLESLSELPRFVLIVGPKGSGKKMLAQWIIEKFGYESETVQDLKIDSVRSIVESSLTLNKPKVFIFTDSQDMNNNAQNAFLKSLEEPSKNAHYIMTVNSEWNLLTTIRSRSIMVRMDAYSKDELAEFTADIDLLKICSTPGQILRFLSFDYLSLLSHCEKVIDVLGRINIGNVFNILKHVDESQYDLIIPVLQYVINERLSTRNYQELIKQLRILQETSITLEHSSTVNVKNALETMFLKLWGAM